MRTLKYILLYISISGLGCINKGENPDTGNSSLARVNITKEEVKAKLGDNYIISVASIAANHGQVFNSTLLDTTIIGKYKIEDIKNKKTLKRKIDTNKPFDSNMINQYQFQSLPKFSTHFINYNIDCDVPLVRISAAVDDYCTLSITTKDKNDKYMTLPLYKVLSIKGYSGKVTSEIKGCEIKRVIEETFGTSSSYIVNGVNILPKRKKEQTFKLESDGKLILVEEENFLTNINYFE